MSKYISAAFFRDVVNRQRFGGEDEGISFDYMLELIEIAMAQLRSTYPFKPQRRAVAARMYVRYLERKND